MASSALAYPSGFQLNRLPQDDDELWWTVFGLWGYRIPRHAVCPGHTAPFKAFADAYFARYPSMIWKASRGLGGKSRTLAVLGLTEAALLSIEVTILGGSFAQSKNVHDATKEAWDWHAAPKHLIDRSNQYDTILHKVSPGAMKGGHLRTLTASQTSVRGPHPPRLRMDEIDEMDQRILDGALGQPMEQIGTNGYVIPTQTVMSSTHQYPDKAMSEMIKRAHQDGHPVYEWCISHGATVTTDRGGVAIQDVTTDDKVLTRKGWRPVQHVTLMGYKKTVQVAFSDGTSLVCTPNHRVAVPGGWQEAGSLTASSVVISLARPAVAASVRPDVCVGDRVLVGAGAVGLQVPPVVVPVLSGHADAQMGLFDAQTDTALMIDFHAGDVVPEQPHDGSMDQLLTVGLPVDESVSVALANSPFPDQTAVGVTVCATKDVVDVSHGAIVPVYDIGVEDEHEFVANGIVVHNCYRESANPVDGWLTQNAIDRARSVVSEHMWNTEYDLQEPSFAGRAIDSDAVERCFDPAFGLFEGEGGVFAPHVEGRHYITAVDWAKHRDFTIIATFDTTERPWMCVAWHKVQKLPWPLLVKQAIKQWRLYGDRLIHDATGVGDFVHDYIKAEVSATEWGRVTGRVFGGGRERDAFYEDYIAAIEHDEVRYPRITFAYNEHKYVTPDALFTSKEHTPDSVVVGALAWHTRKRHVAIVSPGGGVRGSSPWSV